MRTQEHSLNSPAPSILTAIDVLKQPETPKPNGADPASPIATTKDDLDYAQKTARRNEHALITGLAAIPVSLVWAVLEGFPGANLVEQGLFVLGAGILAATVLGSLVIAGHLAAGLWLRR